MADNVAVTAGAGTTIAADEIVDGVLGTVKVQYVKLIDGTLDGTTKVAATANGLKVDPSAVTSPVSAASLPLPTGASTETTLAALNTKINTEITADYDTGAGTQTMKLVGLALPGAGGSVAGGTATNPVQVSLANTAANATAVKVDGSAVTQPVSGTVSANATQTGTWTVQPGNTANTTAWKVQLYDGTTALPVLAGSSGAPAASAPALAVSVRDANANGQAAMSASAPVAIASDQTIINKAVTQSSGTTDSRVDAAATTNATSLKASAGNIFSIDVYNVAAYDVFLKLYNKASAPTVGTDVPVWTIPIKTGSGFSRDFPRGRNFATGIAYAITKLQADTDVTAVAAHDLTGTIGWI